MKLIEYGIHKTPLGYCLIAVTDGAICQLAFMDNPSDASAQKLIDTEWPGIVVRKNERATKVFADKVFLKKGKQPLDLVLKGTDFQIAVWKELLKIPEGKTVTYAEVAKKIGYPKAVRAVGSACGKNAIAYLIPCHRVLPSSGSGGGYRWGTQRKKRILAKEGAV